MSKFAAVFLLFAGMLAAALAGASSDEGFKVRLKTGTIDTSGQATAISVGDRNAGGGFYIVQFDGPVMEEWKEALQREGVKFYSYIPENAFLVKLNPKINSSIIFSPHVRFVGEYKPEYRVAPELEGVISEKSHSITSLASESSILQLQAKVFDGESLRPIVAAIAGMGGKVKVLSDGDGLNEKLLKVDIPFYLANAVAGVQGIEWVEPSPRARFCMDQARIITTASFAQSLPKPLDGTGEVVGILDSGLDSGNRSTLHQAFRGRLVGYKSYRSDGSWADEYDHGTVVTGIMAGGYYGIPYQGMAPGSKIYVQAGQTYADYMITPQLDKVVFADAFGAGARVHNNSWVTLGGQPGEYDLQAVQVDTFTWQHKNFLPVFAAGDDAQDLVNNSNPEQDKTPDNIPDLGSVATPGTAKNALTVGGTHSWKATSDIYRDVFGNTSSFGGAVLDAGIGGAGTDKEVMASSGRGPTADGRIKPDLVAPGTVLATTYSSYPNFDQNGYWQFDYVGTSASAPMVTGAAAIVRQYYRSMRGKMPSAALIKATLINGAQDIGTWNAALLQPFKRPDFHEGWGRLNVMGSIYPGQPDGNPSTIPNSFLAFIDNTKGVHQTNGGFSYHFNIKYPFDPANPDPKKVVRVTLAWIDYPGAAGASTELVNDLDLTVVAPDGSVYTAVDAGKYDDPNGDPAQNFLDPSWKQDPNRPALADDNLGYDHKNNVESIDFIPTVGGDFLINVYGKNIPQPPQPFAIVVTGGIDMKDIYSISGKALQYSGKTGTPYSSPVVVVATGPVITAAVTAVDGSFTLSSLTPGNYYVNIYDAYPGGTILSKQQNVKVTISSSNKNGLVLKGN